MQHNWVNRWKSDFILCLMLCAWWKHHNHPNLELLITKFYITNSFQHSNTLLRKSNYKKKSELGWAVYKRIIRQIVTAFFLGFTSCGLLLQFKTGCVFVYNLQLSLIAHAHSVCNRDCLIIELDAELFSLQLSGCSTMLRLLVLLSRPFFPTSLRGISCNAVSISTSSHIVAFSGWLLLVMLL